MTATLPFGPALQRLQELLGDDRLRIAFALDREFVHVHGIGDVDREDQLDIDGRPGVFGQSAAACWPGCLGPARHCRHVTAGQRAREQHRPDRDTPAHQLTPPIVNVKMVTRKSGGAKQEHRLSFTFRLAITAPQ